MKKDLRRNMLRDQVVEKMSGTIDVGGEEVQKYYDDNLKRFIQKEQVKVSRILVRVAPKAEGAELKKAEDDAKKIRAQAAKKSPNVGYFQCPGAHSGKFSVSNPEPLSHHIEDTNESMV